MSNQTNTPIANAVLDKLTELSPIHIELENESMNHSGYFEGKESHFKLTIVSDAFLGTRMVARHQKIYQILSQELTSQGGSIHALAIHAYTPDEWQEQIVAPASPQCASRK